MDSSRKQIGDALELLLPGTYTVHHYPKRLDFIGNDNDGTLVIERRIIAPATPGTYDETFYIWVLTGVEDEELAEDALDAALEEVQGALELAPWCTPPTATREMYGESFHAYRLEISTKSMKKENPA